MVMAIKDELLKVTRALPNGAAAVTSGALDTGKGSSRDDQLAQMELLLSAPALTVTEQPNSKTMIYDIVGSDNADLSAPSVTVTAIITQTGAGGVGAAAQTKRYRIPSDGPRYWGFIATGSASGNSTTASATLQMVF